MRNRILFNLLLIVSIFFFPWWVVLIVGALFLLAFIAPEVLILGLIADFLYSASIPNFFGFQFVFSLTFLIFLVTAIYMRKHMSLYSP
jgi:hypothetical protein